MVYRPCRWLDLRATDARVQIHLYPSKPCLFSPSPPLHECACSLTEISIKAVTVLPANNLRSHRHTEREKIRQKVNVSSLKFLQVSRSKYVYPQFLGNYIIHRLGRGSRGVGEEREVKTVNNDQVQKREGGREKEGSLAMTPSQRPMGGG